MSDDSRCCGTGTCMINAKGECWCGQRWDGDTMCATPLQQNTPDDHDGVDDGAKNPADAA